MPKRPVIPDDLYLLKTVFDPRLSPDSKRVAYVVSWADRESDETHMSVYVAPANGRGPARRFTHGTRDHSPRWSPDGRYLAFISNRGEKAQIYLAPLDGGEPHKLTSAKFGVTQPAWSPDGGRIVYAARVGDYKEPKERKGAEKAQPRVVRDLGHKLDAIGVYGARRPEGEWSRTDPAVDQAEVDAMPHPQLVEAADGAATVKTYTVVHGRDGQPAQGIVIGRLEDDRRFIANTPPDDADLLRSMTAQEFVGARGTVRHDASSGMNVFSV